MSPLLFPYELHERVCNPDFPALKWSEDGSSFFLDKNLWRDELPGCNPLTYKSCAKQIGYYYGFQRVNRAFGHFRHPLFHRDRPEQLDRIKPLEEKKNQRRNREAAGEGGGDSKRTRLVTSSPPAPPPVQTQQELDFLRAENERLRAEVEWYRSENEMLRKLPNSITSMLHRLKDAADAVDDGDDVPPPPPWDGEAPEFLSVSDFGWAGSSGGELRNRGTEEPEETEETRWQNNGKATRLKKETGETGNPRPVEVSKRTGREHNEKRRMAGYGLCKCAACVSPDGLPWKESEFNRSVYFHLYGEELPALPDEMTHIDVFHILEACMYAPESKQSVSLDLAVRVVEKFMVDGGVRLYEPVHDALHNASRWPSWGAVEHELFAKLLRLLWLRSAYPAKTEKPTAYHWRYGMEGDGGPAYAGQTRNWDVIIWLPRDFTVRDGDCAIRTRILRIMHRMPDAWQVGWGYQRDMMREVARERAAGEKKRAIQQQPKNPLC